MRFVRSSGPSKNVYTLPPTFGNDGLEQQWQRSRPRWWQQQLLQLQESWLPRRTSLLQRRQRQRRSQQQQRLATTHTTSGCSPTPNHSYTTGAHIARTKNTNKHNSSNTDITLLQHATNTYAAGTHLLPDTTTTNLHGCTTQPTAMQQRSRQYKQ